MESPLEKLYNCMVTGALGIVSAPAKQSLNQLGLTDNEKEILKKHSCKFFWNIILRIKYYLKTKRSLFLKLLWQKQKIQIW